MSGEFRVYGRYQGPFGFGRMQIDDGVGYGEAFDTASAAHRFEGNGVRLDRLDVRKSTGAVTGAAFVGWDGTYSFNADGRRVPVVGRVARANRVDVGAVRPSGVDVCRSRGRPDRRA